MQTGCLYDTVSVRDIRGPARASPAAPEASLLGVPPGGLPSAWGPHVGLNPVFQGRLPGWTQTHSHERHLQAQWHPEGQGQGQGQNTGLWGHSSALPAPSALLCAGLQPHSVACVSPPARLLPEGPSMGLGPGHSPPLGATPEHPTGHPQPTDSCASLEAAPLPGVCWLHQVPAAKLRDPGVGWASSRGCFWLRSERVGLQPAVPRAPTTDLGVTYWMWHQKHRQHKQK